MLETIATALRVKGRRNAAIAREIGRTPDTVTAWFSGKNPIPARIRQALDSALGHPVDWSAYDDEFAAKARASTRPAPAPRPIIEPPPPAPPAPVKIASARQRPATASHDVWGTSPTPKAATPAPARAPAPPPAPRRGFLSNLFVEAEGDML